MTSTTRRMSTRRKNSPSRQPTRRQAEWEVIANHNLVPEDKRAAVRNNGGGRLNHSLF